MASAAILHFRASLHRYVAKPSIAGMIIEANAKAGACIDRQTEYGYQLFHFISSTNLYFAFPGMDDRG
jgi:hypothetical protein